MVYYCTWTIYINITILQNYSGNSRACTGGQYQAIFLLPRGLSTRLSPPSPSHIPPTIYMPVFMHPHLPTYHSLPSPLPRITHPLTPSMYHSPPHPSMYHSPPSPLPCITHPLTPSSLHVPLTTLTPSMCHSPLHHPCPE